jgi:phospholipid/cholesterol/gamma-HCH transport system substrate-binding protein
VGNSVEMLGMEIGRVADFRMDQEKLQAIVTLKVDKKIEVYDDAIASIKTAGLIGDKYVDIDPGGGGDLLADGETIIETESPADLGELISKYAFGGVDDK